MMRKSQAFTALAAFSLLTAFLSADCISDQDHRSNKNGGLLISDFIITGTQTLSYDELSTISNGLIGSCFDEDSGLEEWVRSLFQDRGFFGVEVKSLSIKPTDPIAVPKPVTLEADVSEGPQYRLAEIKFGLNHAFSAAELRSKFPLKKGDLFSRAKIASGLDQLRELYTSHGFLNFTSIPNTEFTSDATVILSVEVDEGRQFHMGKLEVFAKKDLADKLQAAWELPEGAVFDGTYLNKFIASNRSLLPPEFQRAHAQTAFDCKNSTVDVRLPLDPMDPRSQSAMTGVLCDLPDAKPVE